MAMLFAFLTVQLRVDQVLVGLAITIFAAGLTGYLFRDLFGGQNVSADVRPMTIRIPGLADLPIVGTALFDRQALFYLCWLLVPIAAFVLNRTRFGLNVRSVGENPFAADAAGVDLDLAAARRRGAWRWSWPSRAATPWPASPAAPPGSPRSPWPAPSWACSSAWACGHEEGPKPFADR